MDVKRLHAAIKELRAELDRVNTAIQQIETIAKAGDERQIGSDSPKPERPPAKRRGKRD